MTTPPKHPTSYRRRKEDGILERIPGTWTLDRVEEAVMGYYAGKRRLECIHRVSGSGMGSHPCGKPPKHDPDWQGNPTHCGIHSEAAKAKRKAKSDAKLAAWTAEHKRQDALHRINAEAPEIIRKIAEGHNDPRGLCADWIKRKGEV